MRKLSEYTCMRCAVRDGWTEEEIRSSEDAEHFFTIRGWFASDSCPVCRKSIGAARWVLHGFLSFLVFPLAMLMLLFLKGLKMFKE